MINATPPTMALRPVAPLLSTIAINPPIIASPAVQFKTPNALAGGVGLVATLPATVGIDQGEALGSANAQP